MTTCDYSKRPHPPATRSPGALEDLLLEHRRALRQAAEYNAASSAEDDHCARARDIGYAHAAVLENDLAAAVAPDVAGLRAQAEMLRWLLDNGSMYVDAIDRRLVDRIIEGLARLECRPGAAAPRAG